MWDFDPSWALAPDPLLVKKAMYNSRVVLSHALIYNDGGFDVSRCGQYLAICADFSLRQAEKEVEMEAEMDASTDLEQILSSAPHENPVEVASPNDDMSDVSVPNGQATSSTDSSAANSSAVPAAPSFSAPSTPTPIRMSTRMLPNPPGLLPPPNMLAVLRSAASDLSLDQFTNHEFRRVRPRLNGGFHRQPIGLVRPSALNPVASQQQRFTQIRPNIALSRTRFTRTQRDQRGRLASEIQSTWLALISLDPHQLGRVIQTCHLAETAAGGVTSVKISPTSAYVLLGYGVRDRQQRCVCSVSWLYDVVLTSNMLTETMTFQCIV